MQRGQGREGARTVDEVTATVSGGRTIESERRARLLRSAKPGEKTADSATRANVVAAGSINCGYERVTGNIACVRVYVCVCALSKTLVAEYAARRSR